eukprot:gene6728-10893_t
MLNENDKAVKNIDHIILSEFDIDKGSTIKLIYPQLNNFDQKDLAEKMLPDGIHNRVDDWTYFFLNNETNDNFNLKKRLHKMKGTFLKAPEESNIIDIHSIEWVQIGEKITNIQFLRTGNNISIIIKIVKEFVNPKNRIIGKFRIPSEEDNEVLYQTEVDKDLNIQIVDTNYQEEGNHFITMYDKNNIPFAIVLKPEDSDLFMKVIQKANDSENLDEITVVSNKEPFMYCMNYVKTKKEQNIKRGALVKSLTFCSTNFNCYSFNEILKQLLNDLLEDKSGLEEEIIKTSFDMINLIEIPPLKKPTFHESLVWKYSVIDKYPLSMKQDILFQDVKYQLEIPFDFQDQNLSITNLVKNFKQDTMTIFNGLLEERRVLFVGWAIPTEMICFSTMSACLLIDPIPLNEIIKRRLYPYASLSSMYTELKSSGYIAGVANPMFKQRKEVWDILCDLDNNTITVSDEILKQEQPQHTELDQKFISNMIALIDVLKMQGKTDRYIEMTLRSHFREYTLQLCKIATDDSLSVKSSEEQKYLLISNAERINNWKSTNSFHFYIQSLEMKNKERKIQDKSVDLSIEKLKCSNFLDESEIIGILQNFIRYIKTDEEMIEFLTYFPESKGGLQSIAILLFHSSEVVKILIVTLFDRLDSLKEGRSSIARLDTFLMLTFDRISKSIKIKE